MEQLMNLLENSGSPFHVVETCEKRLVEAGFEKLDWHQMLCPTYGMKYYLKPYPSMLIAFRTQKKRSFFHNIRMAAAHTDQPCFHVKPNPEMLEKGYMKVNVEAYGGATLSTWMDRPLGLAGKVILRSDKVFEPKTVLFDSKRPIAIIPNLAIHMNREMNKGVELNKQKDMIPLLGMLNEQWNEDDYFVSYLAKELAVEKDEILDFDLFFYNMDKPEIIGLNKELISAPRLDNLASCAALVDGIIKAEREGGINMIMLYDNEEIGSRSKQGADSNLIEMLLRAICIGMGQLEGQYMQTIAHSMYLSVDGGHAMHPNVPEKADPTNKALLGKGPVLKVNGNQRYASDSEMAGAMKQLMEKHQIPYQVGIDRSDMVGGSTLGPILAGILPMRGADMGIPMLAMHSARELAAVADYEALRDTIYAYFIEA